MEEREGFEPSRRYRQLIFETSALNHSATSPLGLEKVLCAHTLYKRNLSSILIKKEFFMYRLLILLFPMILHSEDVSQKKIAEISVEDLTNIVRMIVQEAMTNCTVTGEMNGRAKLNLDVEGEVVARLECFFEEEAVLTEEEPLVEDD